MNMLPPAPDRFIESAARSPQALAAQLLPVTEWCAANHIDMSAQIRRLVGAWFPDLACEDLFDDTEAAIAECYAELRNLSPNHPEYTEAFERLRTLQRSEAEHLRASFEKLRTFDASEARDRRIRAEALLAAHEDPATND